MVTPRFSDLRYEEYLDDLPVTSGMLIDLFREYGTPSLTAIWLEIVRRQKAKLEEKP